MIPTPAIDPIFELLFCGSHLSISLTLLHCYYQAAHLRWSTVVLERMRPDIDAALLGGGVRRSTAGGAEVGAPATVGSARVVAGSGHPTSTRPVAPTPDPRLLRPGGGWGTTVEEGCEVAAATAAHWTGEGGGDGRRRAWLGDDNSLVRCQGRREERRKKKEKNVWVPRQL